MKVSLIACPECDLLQRLRLPAAGMAARCGRCEAALHQPVERDLDKPLAYTLAAGVLFLIANAFPIVGLELQGQSSSATLFGTARALYEENMKMLSILVALTTIVVPAVQLAVMTYVLVPLKLERVPEGLGLALRILQAVRPWGMIEVFILGLLVSLVKLAGMANVEPGIGLWSFGALLLMIAAAVASFDARAIWARPELAR